MTTEQLLQYQIAAENAVMSSPLRTVFQDKALFSRDTDITCSVIADNGTIVASFSLVWNGSVLATETRRIDEDELIDERYNEVVFRYSKWAVTRLEERFVAHGLTSLAEANKNIILP